MKITRKIILFCLVAALHAGKTYTAEFLEAAYQDYMERIKDLNPTIYEQLIDYEEAFHEPAFLKAEHQEATVLLPTKESHGQPTMILPSNLSDEELEPYLASYRALERRNFIPGEYDFSDAEYQHYMKLIKELDPALYHNLREYEWETGKHALSKVIDKEPNVLLPSDDNLHASVFIKSMLDKTENEQKEYLKGLLEKATPDSESNEDDEFSLKEYEEYMHLINQIDPAVYKELRTYETQPPVYGGAITPFSRGILKDKDIEDYEIEAPNESTYWMPLILMKSLHHLSQAEKLEKITQIIEKYTDVVNAHTPPSTFFPPEEYEEYMRIIKDLNSQTYEKLRTCEKELGHPCLKEGEEYKKTFPTSKTHGYPLIIFESLKNWNKTLKKPYLQSIILGYKPVPAITQQERVKVLNIIKELAPQLYEKIITVDPTGEDHIKQGNTSMSFSAKDGLPLLRIDNEKLNESDEKLRWIIGHELSHYVNRDMKDICTWTHKNMSSKESSSQEYAPGRKIANQLPLEETFRNAQSRVREYAADAGSVLLFGTSIDAGLKFLEASAKNEISEDPKKETFKITHPLSGFGRKDHLESLRAEVERRKASGQKPAPIDWDMLIDYYKNETSEPLTEDPQ